MPQRTSVWRYFDEFPPVAVRLLGRQGSGRGCKGLATQEVARGSGLSIEQIQDIEQRTSWVGIDLKTAEAFCRGCRFDPTLARDRRDRYNQYLVICERQRTTPWWYLRNAAEWPKFKRLISVLMSLRSYSPNLPAKTN